MESHAHQQEMLEELKDSSQGVLVCFRCHRPIKAIDRENHCGRAPPKQLSLFEALRKPHCQEVRGKCLEEPDAEMMIDTTAATNCLDEEEPMGSQDTDFIPVLIRSRCPGCDRVTCDTCFEECHMCGGRQCQICLE